MKNRHYINFFRTGIAVLMAAPFSVQADDRIIEREIPQMKEAPVIDGDLSDWDISAFSLGSLAWKSRGDFGADVRLAWDKKNVYIAVTVSDQKLVNTNEPASGLYRGDQVRVRMSAMPGGQGGRFKEGDRELFIAPTSANGEPACTFKSGGEPAQVIPAEGGDLEWAVETHKGGYRVECRIPASLLGAKYFKKGDDALAYVLAVYDRDDPNKDEWSQFHTRLETSEMKSAPAKWPLLRLAEEVLVLDMP
ncbi:MAG: sugar-binding protein [Kiritimatiellia bacterium]